MQRSSLALLVTGTLALASCGQQEGPSQASIPTPSAGQSVAEQISEFARRPELQDAETQAILREHANNPRMLESLKIAYGEAALPSPAADDALAATQAGLNHPPMTSLATGKAGYAQSVAWGTYSNFVRERASPNYPGLVWWGYDGCSAPKYTGLGYRDDFRPACDVHDFGYRNLPHLISIPYWPYNRARTDLAFLRNMRSICEAKVWYKEPPCFAAAQAYYEVVNVAGIVKWHR